jgi:hypothetical protein
LKAGMSLAMMITEHAWLCLIQVRTYYQIN